MKDKYFYENINLVYYVLKKYKSNSDDLRQAGYMGLLQASRTYNPKLGKFSSYAIKLIDSYIKQEIKCNYSYKINNKIFKIIKYIEENDFRYSDLEKKFNVSKKTILEAINYKAITVFDESIYLKEDKFDEFVQILEEIDKRIIIYRYKYNLVLKDISRLLNISESSVSKRCKKALSKLFEFVC